MDRKKELFKELIDDMKMCECCRNLKGKNGVDKSLVNIYKERDLAFNIPSIWTDWFNRLDTDIMVIGQDWGPYQDMKKLYEMYKRGEYSWKELIEMEKSMTKKQLVNYLVESSKGKIDNIDGIYVTNAIMCARHGNNYRGDNIDLKKSTMDCSKFLKRQIDIVKPKVIVTLGMYPLKALASIYSLDIGKNLRDVIRDSSIIEVDGMVIIPMYHPVAQVSREEQMEQYYRIWNYI